MAINSRGQYEATDQAAVTFVESQAAKIEPTAHEEALVDLQYPELIQMYTDMDPADDMLVSYISRPGTGRMTPLSNGATDIPMTDIEYDVMTRQAFASGLSYGWNDMEIDRAQRLNRPLRADKVKAAYRVAEEEKERTVLFGNTAYGWPGLIANQLGNGQEAFNAGSYTINTAFTGNSDAPHVITATDPWASSDADSIFNDIRRAFDAVFASSDKIEVPDTLLLPNRASTFLFNMIKVANAGISTMSLWDFIEQNNPYTKMGKGKLMIRMVNELDTQDGGDYPLAILYSSNLRARRFIMPEDLNFIPPQRVAWTQTFYGKMKLGGIQHLRPKSMCIIGGIGKV